MKGMVFTEFLSYVAARHGDDTVDDIIDAAALPSGGAYTSVGTYNHGELVALCQELSAHVGEPVAELVKGFGTHLSGCFAQGYPDFYSRSQHFFDFLESIEAHIHKEVRKLYPDAELPSFKVHERGATHLVLDYHSPRRLGALAEGLISGTAGRFGVKAQVRTEPLPNDDGGDLLRFFIDLV